MKILRESTPLTDSDCFMIFSRKKSCFDFPLHTHYEMELNLIINAAGSSRVIGNHVGNVGDIELVLVNGETPHTWFTNQCTSAEIYEITLQFSPDLLGEKLMNRNQMLGLKKLFDEARCGIVFPRELAEAITPRMEQLYEHGREGGMGSVLELMSILNDLSLCSERILLSDSNTASTKRRKSHSTRLEQVFAYMNQNFARPLTLADVAHIANMTDVAFSRFLKRETGKNFVDTLTDIRMGHVCRMFIDTDMTIMEIAYNCGFNNMANFNRIFKRKKGMPPQQYRKMFIPKKIFV